MEAVYLEHIRQAGQGEVLLSDGTPMQMCDALRCIAPGEMKTVLGNCLAHARRQFVDVVAGFPREVEHVIDEISLVCGHDAPANPVPRPASPLPRAFNFLNCSADSRCAARRARPCVEIP